MIGLFDKEYDFPFYKCESFTVRNADEFMITLDLVNGTDCDDNEVITLGYPSTKELIVKYIGVEV